MELYLHVTQRGRLEGPLISSFCTRNSFCIVSSLPIYQHERHFLYALLNKTWTLPSSRQCCSRTRQISRATALSSQRFPVDRKKNENPYSVVQFIHQQPSCIDVLSGIISDYFVCPSVLLRRFTGTEYRYIRRERYAHLTRDALPAVRECITCACVMMGLTARTVITDGQVEVNPLRKPTLT